MKIFKYLNLLVAVVAALALVLAVKALGGKQVADGPGESAYDRIISKGEFVCGVYSWPPFRQVDPKTGEWTGFSIDLYRRAFATLDIKVVFKELVLGSQVQDLNLHRVDGICDDGPWTMSSGKYLEYSDPVYYSVVYPYVRVGEHRFRSRADLNQPGVVFTGIDGDISVDLVRRLFPKASLASMPATTDVAQLFLNVANGRADVAIVDPTTFTNYSRQNPGKLRPLFGDEPLGRYKSAVSVKKGDFKTLGLVNQVVDNAHAFGIADEELEKVDPQHKNLMRVKMPIAY